MDDTNAKSTIADKIHQAVSTLLETEMRLNSELNDARKLIHHHEEEIGRLQNELAAEQETRRELQQLISKIADLVSKVAYTERS